MSTNKPIDKAYLVQTFKDFMTKKIDPAMAEKVDKVTGSSLATTAQLAQIATNKNAIDILNADANTDGSVKKQIKESISDVTQFEYQVETTLPATGEKGKIYLIEDASSSTPGIYKQYYWNGTEYVELGNTQMNFANYVKKTDIASTLANGLMTTAMVTKLNGIEEEANKTTSDTVLGWGFETTADAAEIRTTVEMISGDETRSGSIKQQIADAIKGVTQYEYEVATTLPTTGEKGKIYIVESTTDPGTYEQYVWNGTEYIDLGDTKLDLNGYVTTADIATVTNNGLMTSAMVSKLVGIEEGATKTDYDDIKSLGFATTTEVKEVETSTKQQITNAISGVTQYEYQKEETLPTTGEKGKIYLIDDPDNPGVYKQYYWNGTEYVELGDTKMDLNGYVKDTDIATTTSNGIMTSAMVSQLNGLETTVELLNSDENTAGSIKNQVKNAISGVSRYEYQKEDVLPAEGEKGKIYVVDDGTGTGTSKEYYWDGTKYVEIGTTDINLNGYVTTADIATIAANGLMTSAMVFKLNGIEAEATKVTSTTVANWGYMSTADVETTPINFNTDPWS